MPGKPRPGSGMEAHIAETLARRPTILLVDAVRSIAFEEGSYTPSQNLREVVDETIKLMRDSETRQSDWHVLLDRLCAGTVQAEASIRYSPGVFADVCLLPSFWEVLRNNEGATGPDRPSITFSSNCAYAKGVEIPGFPESQGFLEFQDIRCWPFDIPSGSEERSDRDLPPDNRVMGAITALRPEIVGEDWTRAAIEARAQGFNSELSGRERRAVATALLPDERRDSTRNPRR